MENQALCQYKHGSVWSKDYDSAGGKKRFCILCTICKKNKNLTLTAQVPNPGEKGGELCMLHVKVLL